MYHIFQVYDYKGGELSSQINLTEEEFIGELIERALNNDEIDLSLSISEIKLQLISAIRPTTEYAGGDSIVIECFKSSDTSLEFIDHEHFIKTNFQLFIDKLKSYEDS